MKKSTQRRFPTSTTKSETSQRFVGGVADERLRAATKALRTEALGLSQQRFSDRFELAYSTVNKYENIQACGDVPLLWKLALAAREAERPDLARVFEEAIDGMVAGGDPSPRLTLRAAQLVRDGILESSDPRRMALWCLRLMRWLEQAEDNDVRRVGSEIGVGAPDEPDEPE